MIYYPFVLLGIEKIFAKEKPYVFMPDTLACVKYFICRDGYESYLPYGYTKLVNSYKTKKGELYHAYENKYVLPLGYTYSNSISYNEYQTLTAIEKQQAMMSHVIRLQFNSKEKVDTRLIKSKS